MRQTLSRLLLRVATLNILVIHPTSLVAQSLWRDWGRDKTIAMEILKPEFDGEDKLTLTTTAVFLALRYPVGANVVLEAELPFSHYGFDSRFSSDRSDNTFGNPYIGFIFRGKNTPVFVELGIRAPMAKEEKGATLIGGFTDVVDRSEAFITNFLPITGMMNYRYKSSTGFILRLRSGPAWWINTDEDKYEDSSELNLVYSAQAGYESALFDFIGGLSGRAWLTNDNLEGFGERTVHQFVFAASFGLGNVRPGLQLRIPIDEDLKEVLDTVVGLHVGIALE